MLPANMRPVEEDDIEENYIKYGEKIKGKIIDEKIY